MDFVDQLVGRPSTLKTYKLLFNKWIRNKPQDLNHLFHIWRSSKLSPRTMKTLINLYCQYMRFLEQPVPAEATQLRKFVATNVPIKPPKAITKEIASKITTTWDQTYPEDTGFLLLGLHAGLRIGEALALDWEDIDFIKSQIEVTKSFNPSLGEVGPTKNGKGRTVPMSVTLEQTLLSRYNTKVADKLYFCSNVNGKLRKLCKKINIKPVTFHVFRHTFATFALESGQSIKTISETLGHSQVSTTLNLYWNLLEKDLDMSFLD